MQSGDVALFKGGGFFGWLIRKWTKSAWPHCGVVFAINERYMIVHARPLIGVQMCELDNTGYGTPTVYPSGRTLNVDKAYAALGSKYSYKDAILAGLNKPGQETGWECAEFAAHVLDIEREDELPWTPQGLANYLFAKGA